MVMNCFESSGNFARRYVLRAYLRICSRDRLLSIPNRYISWHVVQRAVMPANRFRICCDVSPPMAASAKPSISRCTDIPICLNASGNFSIRTGLTSVAICIPAARAA